MSQNYYFNSEKIGRNRLPDNKQFRASLNSQSSLILSTLLTFLPSNYPKNVNTNLSQLFLVLAREAGRIQLSGQLVSNDEIYATTRPDFLYPVLGNRLLYGQQLSSSISDYDLRNILLTLRNAYLNGSTVSTIETVVNNLINLNVVVKELYLEARKSNSGYGLKDTNKMIIELFIDDLLSNGSNVALILENLDFYINLIKPAHVLYDTKLIWVDTIDVNKTHDIIWGDPGAGSIPGYNFTTFNSITEPDLFNQDQALLALKIMEVTSTKLLNSFYTTVSIDTTNSIIFALDQNNNTCGIVIDPSSTGTEIFDATGKDTNLNSLLDSTFTMEYLTIPGDVNFYPGNINGFNNYLSYLPYNGISFYGNQDKTTIEDYQISTLSDNSYAKFYQSNYQLPFFQEFIQRTWTGIDTTCPLDGTTPWVSYHWGLADTSKTTPTTMYDSLVQHSVSSFYEDTRHNLCSGSDTNQTDIIILQERMGNPRFSIARDSSNDRELLGDVYTLILPNYFYIDSTISLIDGTTSYITSYTTQAASNVFSSIINSETYLEVTEPSTGKQYASRPLSIFIEGIDGPGYGLTITSILNTSIYNNATLTIISSQPSNGIIVDSFGNIQINTIGVNATSGDISNPSIYPITGEAWFTLSLTTPFTQLSSPIETTPLSSYPGFTGITPINTIGNLSYGTTYELLSQSNCTLITPYLLTTGSSEPYLVPSITEIINISTDTTFTNVVLDTVDEGINSAVLLKTDATAWNFMRPVLGDILQVNISYIYNDSTVDTTVENIVFGISQWQLQNPPISNGDGSNILASPNDVIVQLDGTIIPNAVLDIEPVGGFLTLNPYQSFWLASPAGYTPTIDNTFTFNYFQSGTDEYSLLYDDEARNLDTNLVYDGEDLIDGTFVNPVPFPEQLQIGYKFRTDLLSRSDSFNSFDTLLNTYQKPGPKASSKDLKGTFNHYNYFFSPEFLTDTEENIILNDDYLKKNIPASIILNPGTPPFQKTWSDQSRWIYDGTITNLTHEQRIQDLSINNRLQLYNDLLLVENTTGETCCLSSLEDTRLTTAFTLYEQTETPLDDAPWEFYDVATLKDATVDVTNIGLSLPTGCYQITYSFYENMSDVTSFTLPPTVPVQYTDTTSGATIWVNFPAYPALHDSTTLATTSDIIVSINGVPYSNIINQSTFINNDTNLYIQLTGQGETVIIENFIITPTMAIEQSLALSRIPTNMQDVIFDVQGGTPQMYGEDYAVDQDIIYWNSNIIQAGDVVRLIYPAYSLELETVSFTYLIANSAVLSVINEEMSCIYDGSNLYPGFADDIPLVYLSLDTTSPQISYYPFINPLITSYNPASDLTGTLASFSSKNPQVLVPYNYRTETPTQLIDSTSIWAPFLGDSSVILRDSTYYQIMPDYSSFFLPGFTPYMDGTITSAWQQIVIAEVLPI